MLFRQRREDFRGAPLVQRIEVEGPLLSVALIEDRLRVGPGTLEVLAFDGSTLLDARH